MNVLDLLDKELKGKAWSEETKSRYLYIRSGQLFSYDPRFFYANTFLKKEILERQINLENVTDFRVVCTSWSEQVYAPLLKELLHKTSCVIKSKFHSLVRFPLEKSVIFADACIKSDLARIKMQNSTENYTKEDDPLYAQNNLFDIDHQINYINDYYSSIKIKFMAQTIQREFQKINNIQDAHLINQDELFIYKITKIKDLLSTWPYLNNYNDIAFAINYLIRKFFTETEQRQIESYELFDESVPDWNFANVYTFVLPYGNTIYYTLAQKNGTYSFDMTSYEESQELINSYPDNQIDKLYH